MAHGDNRRLHKRDVEALLATYDDDPVAALAKALSTLTDRRGATFDELIELLADSGRLTVERRRALGERHVDALDALAAELNETRVLPS